MKLRKYIIAGLLILLWGNQPNGAGAFDFDDLEALEQSEQVELLEEARKAAKAWEFTRAESFLKQARHKAYAPGEIELVANLVAKERAAKAEQERKSREDEQRRLAAQRQRPSSSGGSSGCSKFVAFSFDGPGPEYGARIELSVPSGQYVNGNGSSSVSVGADRGCVGGTYTFSYGNNASWTGGTDRRTYSGSMSISSSASHCSVIISEGFSTDIYVSCD